MRSWGSGLARSQNLVKVKDYNRNLKSFANILKLGNVVSKLVLLKHITNGAPAAGGYGSLHAGGYGGPVAGRFFGKNSYFNAIWITFRTFSEPFETTKL